MLIKMDRKLNTFSYNDFDHYNTFFTIITKEKVQKVDNKNNSNNNNILPKTIITKNFFLGVYKGILDYPLFRYFYYNRKIFSDFGAIN